MAIHSPLDSGRIPSRLCGHPVWIPLNATPGVPHLFVDLEPRVAGARDQGLAGGTLAVVLAHHQLLHLRHVDRQRVVSRRAPCSGK